MVSVCCPNAPDMQAQRMMCAGFRLPCTAFSISGIINESVSYCCCSTCNAMKLWFKNTSDVMFLCHYNTQTSFFWTNGKWYSMTTSDNGNYILLIRNEDTNLIWAYIITGYSLNSHTVSQISTPLTTRIESNLYLRTYSDVFFNNLPLKSKLKH